MVVVEDSNSLVFYTSGTEYQGLLPLLEQLDVLPKQVVLDIVIAEVTLKDEFRFGFEWALQNSEVSLTTLGAFGASSIGGTALAINGSDGNDLRVTNVTVGQYFVEPNDAVAHGDSQYQRRF